MGSDANRVEVELAADAEAASQARTVVSQATAKLPGDLSFRARLAASELVTNSVIHPQKRPQPVVRLVVAISPSGLRVEVRDGGAPFESTPRHPSQHTSSGRGLQLVDVLVDRWGTDHEDANLVWFEIDTTTDEQPNPRPHHTSQHVARRSPLAPPEADEHPAARASRLKRS